MIPPIAGPRMKPREPAALKPPRAVVRIASGASWVVITIEGTNTTEAATPIAPISTKSPGGPTKPTAAVPRP